MTKTKTGAILLLSILLSSLLIPLAGATDNGKSLLKEMVQEPAEYSVGACFACDYIVPLHRWGYMGGYMYMLRQDMTDYRFYRLWGWS